MSHKLDFEKAPADNLKTWAMLKQLTVVLSVLLAISLIVLFFVFMYEG